MKYPRITLIILAAIGLAAAGQISDNPVTHKAKKYNTVKKNVDYSFEETAGYPLTPSNIQNYNNIDITSNRIHEGIKITNFSQRETNEELLKWGTDIPASEFGDTSAYEPFLVVTASGEYWSIYKYVSPTSGINYITFNKSTDGYNWLWQGDFAIDDTTHIKNLDVVVDDDADTTFIFVVVQARNDQIWLLRYNYTTGNANWVQITSGSVYDPAIDDFPSVSSHAIYIAYLVKTGTTDQVRFRASFDYGLTWGSPYLVDTSGVHNNPDFIVIYGDSVWGIIVWDDIATVKNKTNKYYGFSGWITAPRKTHNFRAGSDDIKPQLTGRASGDTLWLVAEENIDNSGDWNLVWDYSTDEGLTWRADTSFPNIDLANDSLRNERNFQVMYDISLPISARVAYISQGASDIRIDYQFFSGYSGSWSLTTGINDYEPRPNDHPSVNYIDAFLGGGVLYVSHSGVWLDGWNVDVKEDAPATKNTPTINILPVNEGVLLTLNLPTGKMTKINIYSPTGRVVKSINKYFNSGKNTYRIHIPKTGIYFIKIDNQKAKALIIK